MVQSVSPGSGPAGGGGLATITGTGLGAVVSVAFGKATSAMVANPKLGFVSQSDTEVIAEIPPGPPGKAVHITVTTLDGSSAPGATFTYKKSAPSAPASVQTRPGAGSILVSWTRSASDGGSPLQHYVVSAIPRSGQGLAIRVPPSVLHATLSPLAPGVSYKVSVSAENAIGLSSRAGRPVVPALGDNGYLLAAATGDVAGYGSLAGAPSGIDGQKLAAPIVGLAATPDGLGYWLADADGAVYALGAAHQLGWLPGRDSGRRVAAIAAMPSGRGYWLLTTDGGVFNFGDASWYGSLASRHLSHKVVGIATTPDGRGYWLVTSNGDVFKFGDASTYGSLAGKKLSYPVVGIAITPDANGYWLVTSDGGIFRFGDAAFHDSLAGKALAAPIVGILATPDGGGYWLLGQDGHVYPLGDAHFEGDARSMFNGVAAAISN
jgi:hypothetical protein